ncbi:nuclear transport factor 2 family protein [Rhodococcus sp. NPDC003318]|uniref:nuclear transport factor 2 family protein n=1 Tax=Rhodococcus sp. NPDC003318 TaxID=3364503 RepID=UPI0036A10417
MTRSGNNASLDTTGAARWSRAELEDAFLGYQRTVEKAKRTGDWNLFADMFTEDAAYIEHAYGTFHGREEIRPWIVRTMGRFPGTHMTAFPALWYTIDEQRGWVICEIDNPMCDPGDGSTHGASNLTILHYAGDGLWSCEEDVYNPMKFLEMARKWCRAAESAGALPDEAGRWLAAVGA